jgi:hypothetical protein
MAEFSPNRRYDHVFAIIRVDRFDQSGGWTDQAITITKAVWSREAAEAEVVRLNHLNKDKGAVYFWRITRLERTMDDQPPVDSLPDGSSLQD